MRDLINFILENWQIIGTGIIALFGIIFGVKATAELKLFIKDIKHIYWHLATLIRTVKDALQDDNLSRQEIKEIAKDLETIKAGFYNLIYFFKHLDKK